MKKLILALSLVSFLGATALIAGDDKTKEKKSCSAAEKKSCCSKGAKDKSCIKKEDSEKKTEEKPQ
jgi:hypothetical protein